MDDGYFQLNRYALPIIVIFGTFGAIINEILFFHRKALRTTSCALYFRVLSINDLIVLWYNTGLVWLSEQFDIEPSSQSAFYCKLSQYLTYVLYCLSPYILVLACFDRFCTSSPNAKLRKIATIYMARFPVLIVIIFVFTVYVYVPVYSELISFEQYTFCIIINPTYRRVLAIALLVIYCLIPPLLMILFCSLTLILLQQQRRRIMPINQIRLRQRDNQLLKMLIIYVTTNICCILPFTITYLIQIYIYNNQFPLQDDTVQYCLILISVTYATSFYVYTLGTPFYRDELKELLKNRWQRIRRNEIAVLERQPKRTRNTTTIN